VEPVWIPGVGRSKLNVDEPTFGSYL